jgi:hypothetical protein
MTKAGALNFFGVLRAFALAFAATGLLIVVATFAASMAMHLPLVSIAAAITPAIFGMFALCMGIVLALVASLTRFLVARMTFASSAP